MLTGRWPLLTSAVLALAVACGEAVTPADVSTPADAGTPTATGTVTPGTAQVPTLDRSLHTAPLADVAFDTFNGSFVRLPDADDALITSLRDLIKPAYEPEYRPASEGDSWLRQPDLVIGLEIGSQAYAYPVKTLNFRELVNDVIDGQPVLIFYCPLCASGVVYSRVLDGRTLLFGNTSALYESDLVMYDHQTGSYWHQVTGEVIVGSLAGRSLEPLSSMVATFGQWRAAHPNSLVLAISSAQAALAIDPTSLIQSSANGGSFAFPVTRGREDERLKLGDLVLALNIGGQWRAYPLSDSVAGAANDVVGGGPLVVFSQGPTAAAYFSSVDGKVLSFTPVQPSGGDGPLLYLDTESGSTWNLAGRAVAGPSQGTQLESVPTRRGFRFSIAGAYPGIELYE